MMKSSKIIFAGLQAMFSHVRKCGHLMAVVVLTLTWGTIDLRAEIRAPVVDVIQEDGGVRIKASAAGRLDILQALSLEVGIDIYVIGRVPDGIADWNIGGKSTEKVVRNLFRDVSVIIVTDYPDKPAFVPSGIRIYFLEDNWGSREPVSIIDGQMLTASLEGAIFLQDVAMKMPDERAADLDRLRGLNDELAMDRIGLALQHDPDSRVRALAVELFAAAEQEQAIRGLTIGLGDVDPEIRKQVARALSVFRSEDAVMLIAQQSQGDPDADVRREALAALESAGTELALVFVAAGRKEE